MKQFVARLLREDDGQDLVEDVLLVSLIALAVAAAFPPVTTAITQVFTNVQTRLGGGAPEVAQRSPCGRSSYAFGPSRAWGVSWPKTTKGRISSSTRSS